MTQDITQLLEDFEFLDNWEDRYRYVIELGRDLEPLPEDARNAVNKVKGCVSQVWLETTRQDPPNDPALVFRGDSDAHIVRGLIAILITLYSGRQASDILNTDARAVLGRMSLTEHLTPQRSNGLFAMVERIRRDAQAALDEATVH